MSEQPDIKGIVNNFLDAIMQREKLGTDADLARYLGTHQMNIYRWRRGEIGRSTKILLPLALQSASTAVLTPTLN